MDEENKGQKEKQTSKQKHKSYTLLFSEEFEEVEGMLRKKGEKTKLQVVGQKLDEQRIANMEVKRE